MIVDEPTTGLDPEERIRIRNLLVDFSENRTILFSTHVVEDLAATCSKLAVMKKGNILYSGDMKEMLSMADGCVWNCFAKNDIQAREIEKNYRVSTKQYVNGGYMIRVISEEKPEVQCTQGEVTLEDAYIYLMNK